MRTVTIRGIAQQSIHWSIGISLLMILAGMLALAAPLAAGLAGTAVFAWGMTLLGFLHLWLAWHTRGTGATLWEVLVAAAYFAAGGYMLAHPVAGLVTLTLLLTCYFVVKGVVELAGSFSLGGLPGRSWLMFDGVLCLVIAALIWFHLPSSTTWAVGVMVGVAMLFSGISRLFLSLAARRMLAIA